MPQVTLQTNDEQDARWLDARPAVINLLCSCLWDEETGDLRAHPDCEGHRRDVIRYAQGGTHYHDPSTVQVIG